jgi:hypothetical protein
VLISGALVIQLVRIGWVCWYRLRFVVGVGRRMSGVRVGWAHCWVLRERAFCLFSCGAGLLPYRFGLWWLGLALWALGSVAVAWVFGGGVGWLLFVVCELHSGREHLCGQVF